MALGIQSGLTKSQPGLQILKIDEDSRRPINGVEMGISKMNGERLGTYRTDSDGLITLPEIAPGWYQIEEVKAKDGYMNDTAPHNIEVKAGGAASITITNKKAASIVIHKVDSVTKEGIYGVTFLLYDESGKPYGQYITDQEGYVFLSRELLEGKYTIRELQPADGYANDNQIKTIQVVA